MNKRLCIVLSFVLAFLLCGSISNVKGVSAASYESESIVLNVDDQQIELIDEYPGATIITPSTNATEEDEEKKIQTSVVLIVCLVSIFGVIALIFVVGVSIGVGYFKYSKSSRLVDKTKNSIAGRIALRIAKASGHPVASTVATAVEKAPTWMSQTKNYGYDDSSQEDLYDDYY